jgi:thiol-disulfide isomerase/thioredoxin
MALSRRTALALPLLGLAAAGVAGCSDVDGTNGKGYITGDGRIIPIAEKDRADPVTYAGKDLDGNPLSFETYRGKVVMASIWGAWCGPCRVEMPDVVELAGQVDAATTQILGVNIREDGGTYKAKSYVTEIGMTFPSFYDPGSAIPQALSSKIAGPYTLPASAVLDVEGRVGALVIGPIPSVLTMRQALESMVSTNSVGERSDG